MRTLREQLLCSYKMLLTCGWCRAVGIDDRTDLGPLDAGQEEWLSTLRDEASKDGVSVTSDTESVFGEFFFVRAVAYLPAEAERGDYVRPESAEWRQRFEQAYADVLPAARARVAAELAALPRRVRLQQAREIQARMQVGESWRDPMRDRPIESTTPTTVGENGDRAVVGVSRFEDGSSVTRARHPDGSPKSEQWRDAAGKLDRLDGPAVLEWHSNGVQAREEWMVGGVGERAGGPATRRWYRDGCLREERWALDDLPHRVGGPCHRSYNAEGELVSEEWRVDGVFTRSDGPARISWTDGNTLTCEQSWYVDGRLHRDDGPAKQSWNWQGMDYFDLWYRHGQKHRDDGPAGQGWHTTETGVLHHQSWTEHDQALRTTTTADPVEIEPVALPARPRVEPEP